MSKYARINFIILGVIASVWLSMFWGVWIAYPVSTTVIGLLALGMNAYSWEYRSCRKPIREYGETKTRCALSDKHDGICRDYWGYTRGGGIEHEEIQYR